ncbi:MAG: DUF4115 domain-containing protein [Sphingobium sp.]
MDEVIPEADSLAEDRPDRPGALLRAAREERGMSLSEVAEATRVAQRQLEAIERSDFAALPGTPYAVGFARAYARAVGADEVAVARGVREELGALDAADRYEMFEPADPARIPSRGLAWTTAVIAVVLAVGYAVWRTQFFAASTDQEISDLSNRAGAQAQAQADAALDAAKTPAEGATGPVVLTAVNDVWLRIYDAGGERLFEKQMLKGDSYTVPPQANNPMILTGRPDALTVTVGGKPVAPLGPPERTIADVPISAEALLARATTGEQSTTTGAAVDAVADRQAAAPAEPAPQKPPRVDPAVAGASASTTAASPASSGSAPKLANRQTAPTSRNAAAATSAAQRLVQEAEAAVAAVAPATGSASAAAPAAVSAPDGAPDSVSVVASDE